MAPSASCVASVWPLPTLPARAGSSTRATTMARSSTISQPTAMRPRRDSTRPLSSSARKSTTVLATDRHKPKTIPAAKGQPSKVPSPAPMAVATAI